MDPVLVIFNRHAGRGRGRRHEFAVRAALESTSIPFVLQIPGAQGQGIELARQASLEGRQIIVAAGGDGTVNEVVNGLALAQDPTNGPVGTLGILPIGSGNDFAENMGIPLDLHLAAQKIKRQHTRLVDLGRVNGRFFDNNVGIGFEARVNIESHKITWLKGVGTYLAAVFKSLVSYPFPVVDIDMDDGPMAEKPMLMISVGNNRRIGGGFLLTPDAVPDDGLLDLCIVDTLPRLEVLRLLPKAMKGNHRDEPAALLTRTRRLVVQSQEPLPVHADGEILWSDVHRVEVTVEPRRLRVIV